MNNEQKIAFALLATGIGFAVYKIASNAKGKNDKTPLEPDYIAPKSDDEPQPKAVTYEDKVKALQAIINTTTDGKPGNKTNGILDWYFDSARTKNLETHMADSPKEGFKYLKSKGKGIVSPSNVDWYLQQLRQGLTPRQQLWKSDQYEGMQDLESYNRYKFGRKIEQAYNTGQKVGAVSDMVVKLATFDKSRNRWIETGKSVTIKGNTPWKPGNFNVRYNAAGMQFWELKAKPGNFMIINPYTMRAL